MAEFSKIKKHPNFFIVGSPKSATTSLHEYLKNIPGIFMSPIKEPNYLSRKTISLDARIKPIRDKKKYLALFEDAIDEKIIGESSTTYLEDEDVPSLIHEEVPGARILICSRKNFGFLTNSSKIIIFTCFGPKISRYLFTLSEYNPASR